MQQTQRDGFGVKHRWRGRRALVLAALVLAVGAALGWWLVMRQSDTPSSAVASAQKAAQTASDKGEYDKAYTTLKDALAQAKTKDQKLAVYSDLAAAAANSGKVSEAITYFKQRQQLDPSVAKQDAYVLATLYQRVEKPAEALAQYKVSLEYYRSLPKDPFVDAQILQIEAIITELEATQ